MPAIAVHIAVTEPPSAETAVMITPAMPAAMTAYSIAVVPSRADQKQRSAAASWRIALTKEFLVQSSVIRCDTSGTSAGGIS